LTILTISLPRIVSETLAIVYHTWPPASFNYHSFLPCQSKLRMIITLIIT